MPKADESEQPVTLSVITHTDFRDTSNGNLLKEQRDATLVRQIDNAFDRTLRINYPKMFEAWSHKTPAEKLSIRKKLISPIQTSEYKTFYDETKSIILDPEAAEDKCLKAESHPDLECRCMCKNSDEFKSNRLACISGGYLRSLWVYLASAMVEGSTKSASVELPTLPDMVIPKQTALMRDDGKEKLDIVLRDVSGITPGGISAKLVLQNSDGKSYEFPAEAITANPVIGTLALQFPSPDIWDLGTIDYTKSKLYVERRPCIYEQACAAVKFEPSFEVLHIKAPADKPKPGFDLRASTNEIVVDRGAGTVKLVFDNFKDDNVIITWSGADVKSAKNSDGAAMKIALNHIKVKSATDLTLEIQNAKPDGKVTFKAVGSKNDKKTGEVTKEFTVVASK